MYINIKFHIIINMYVYLCLQLRLKTRKRNSIFKNILLLIKNRRIYCKQNFDVDNIFIICKSFLYNYTVI